MYSQFKCRLENFQPGMFIHSLFQSTYEVVCHQTAQNPPKNIISRGKFLQAQYCKHFVGGGITLKAHFDPALTILKFKTDAFHVFIAW